jgi:DNA-binding Lrp family transcriptional regulator
MQGVKLDRIDIEILAELQADGRMTNVDLAKKVGISAPPCLRRVRALENEGYITGYHASVSLESVGLSVMVYANVGLNSQSENDLLAFEMLVQDWPEVLECHMLAGETDFLLKVASRDWDEYQRFVTTKLTAAPNVAQVKSSLSIRISKASKALDIKSEQRSGGSV